MGSEYAGHDVPQLYAMLQQASTEVETTHTQIEALTRAQQALDEHARVLRDLKFALAEQWPPEKSPASAAYVAELDRLHAAVTDTANAAATNAAFIGYVNQAIVDTRDALASVHREYASNAVQLAQYEQTVNAAGASASMVSGPLGAWAAKGVAGLVLQPPVPDDRQQHLTQQAQQQMDSLATIAREAAAGLQIPAEFIPLKTRVDSGSDGGDGGAIRPPRIDPPAHIQAAETSARHGESAAQAGAVLAGTAAGAATAPLLTTPIAPPAHSPGAPMRVPMPMLPDLSPLNPSHTSASAGRPGGGVNPFGAGTSPAAPGQAPGGAPRRNVNPVGGVIGGDRTGMGTGPGGTSGMGIPGGQPGRGSGKSGSARYRRDPDNPWAIDQGVPGLIEPAPEPEITNGPGVIGIDR